MTMLHKIWQGFQRLFGLNACPAPLPPRRETPQQRVTRERLQQRLKGASPPPADAPSPAPQPTASAQEQLRS